MPGSFTCRLLSSGLRSLVWNARKISEASDFSSYQKCRLIPREFRLQDPIAWSERISRIGAGTSQNSGLKWERSSKHWQGETDTVKVEGHTILPLQFSQCTGIITSRCLDLQKITAIRHGPSSQSRNLAASTAYGAQPRAKCQEGGAGGRRVRKTSDRFQQKSRKGPARARAKVFSGALSSIKDLHSEHGSGDRRSKTMQRSLKNSSVLSGRFKRKPGRTIGLTVGTGSKRLRKSEGQDRRRSKIEKTSDKIGQRIKRKRKRIRPSPRDVTFKRGLNPETPVMKNLTLDERLPVQGKGSSTNALFRQIEPSRELLRHIEENFLGRRRLVEWRRGGYDPKRTAPLDAIPESNYKDRPIQETVFKRKLTFIAAAKQASSLPPPHYQEIAFAGRSNVGKSSLINALVRQWGVARTSEKPGLTQSINFFTLGSQLCLVDLPGYGFAYAKEDKKEQWEELVKKYVVTRSNLKRVCLLVDAKWGLKPRDEELLQLMESANTRYQIILTKTDVMPPLDLARRATQIQKALKDHKCLVQPLMMVSSKTGAGLQLFRASLARLATGQSRLIQEDTLQTNG